MLHVHPLSWRMTFLLKNFQKILCVLITIILSQCAFVSSFEIELNQFCLHFYIVRSVHCVNLFGFQLTFRVFWGRNGSLFAETEWTADGGYKRNGVSHGRVPIWKSFARERERERELELERERERERNDCVWPKSDESSILSHRVFFWLYQ